MKPGDRVRVSKRADVDPELRGTDGTVEEVGYLWDTVAVRLDSGELLSFHESDVEPHAFQSDAVCTACGGLRGHRLGCPIARRSSGGT